ncbi:MAG: hypothetical protein JRJ85_13110 [Deltaproteobacteria bacterium]|nr:hypothetical protein [Deltaproteobacteria bacterium]
MDARADLISILDIEYHEARESVLEYISVCKITPFEEIEELADTIFFIRDILVNNQNGHNCEFLRKRYTRITKTLHEKTICVLFEHIRGKLNPYSSHPFLCWLLRVRKPMLFDEQWRQFGKLLEKDIRLKKLKDKSDFQNYSRQAKVLITSLRQFDREVQYPKDFRDRLFAVVLAIIIGVLAFPIGKLFWGWWKG